jgi:hypothetical protein
MRRMNITALAMSAVVAITASSLTGCVGEAKKDKPKAAAKAPKNFVVAAPPADMKKTGIEFDDKATLLGYKLDTKKGPLKAGDKVSYTLYWKLNKPLDDKGWNLFTHIFDSRDKRLMNVDKVGDLRQSGPNPGKWEVGKIYTDKQTITIPKGVQGNKLDVVAGIWKDKGALKVTKGQKFRQSTNALALSIPLKPGADVANWKPPTLRADRLDKTARILVDGKLTEPAWTTAASTGAFVNVSTGKADAAHPVQGSAKLLWDDKALYVAFEVTDKDIIGGFKKTDVDPHLWTKDTVEIMIDPDGNGDNKDYYEIQVSPQNLVFDSQFDTYNMPKGGPEGPFGNQTWQSKLKSAVVVDGTLDKEGDEDKGYTVELSIPWASLDKAKTTPPALGDTWRMNFYAMQNNSGVAWSPIMGKGNFHKASQFGKVLFAEKGWEPPPPAAMAEAAASGPTSVTAALSTGAPAPALSAAPAAGGAPASAASVTKPAASAGVPAAKPQTPVTPKPPAAAPAAPPATPAAPKP